MIWEKKAKDSFAGYFSTFGLREMDKDVSTKITTYKQLFLDSLGSKPIVVVVPITLSR